MIVFVSSSPVAIALKLKRRIWESGNIETEPILYAFSSLNLSKIWDCQLFSDFKTLTGYLSFSYSEDFNCIL